MDKVRGVVTLPKVYQVFVTKQEWEVIKAWFALGEIESVDDSVVEDELSYTLTHPDFTAPDNSKYIIQLVTVEDNPNHTLHVYRLLKKVDGTTITVKEYSKPEVGNVGVLF